MAYRGGRPSRLGIKRDIQFIQRTFPSQYIRVKRMGEVYNEHGEVVEQFTEVYAGDALVRPSGGTTDTYGMGTVENFDMVLLINGKQNIRQGDVVTINDGREYEVQFPPGWFDAFMEVRLTQRSQVGQPT